jgi:hypothetical protein
MSQAVRGTQEKVLDLIDMSATLTEKAGEVLSRQEQTEKQAADLIPTAVDELLKARLIEPEEKQAALEALRDPVRTLQVLIRSARAKSADNTIALGQPEGTEKRASRFNAHVGARRGERDGESEADRVFRERILGGT